MKDDMTEIFLLFHKTKEERDEHFEKIKDSEKKRGSRKRSVERVKKIRKILKYLDNQLGSDE